MPSDIIPKFVPTTKHGLPNMRFDAAKNWVIEQAQDLSPKSINFPKWLPRLTDGNLDKSKPIVRVFLCALPTDNDRMETDESEIDENIANENHSTNCEDYSTKDDVNRSNLVFKDNSFPTADDNMETDDDRHCATTEHSINTEEHSKENLTDELSEPFLLPNTNQLRESFSLETPYNIRYFSLANLEEIFDSNEGDSEIGKSAFGPILKRLYKDKDVAIKVFNHEDFKDIEPEEFFKELNVLSRLGHHRNIIHLFGYCMQPQCLVMELAALGDLGNLLFNCGEEKVKDKLRNGETKKKILLGIVNGLIQLHAVNIVHGDVKLKNVLITEDYDAKICDFGYSTVRREGEVNDSRRDMAGTKWYMAPELLDEWKLPELSSDVYSFGVLMNEVVQEEVACGEVRLRRSSGLDRMIEAAELAAGGLRPGIDGRTPPEVKELIENCWQEEPGLRPTFGEVWFDLQRLDIPNSFDDRE